MLKNRKPSIYLIGLSLILLVIGLTMAVLVYQTDRSLRNEARIINEAGIVRGSIQRLTKQVLHDPGHIPGDVIAKIDSLLHRFVTEDMDSFGPEGEVVVSEMQEHWLLLKRYLSDYTTRSSEINRDRLVVHSEVCWTASLKMVAQAQLGSEFKLKNMRALLYFMLLLTLAGTVASIVMVVLYVRRKLEYESARDHLTGLYNRRMFDRTLDSEVARSSRYNSPLSILVIDIDFFKSVNDELGHKAGDRVLIEFAGLVADSIRETDRLFRVGGEEFVVLTPGVGKEVALQMAEKLRIRVKSHGFSIERPVTVSIGVCEFVNGETSDRLYQLADQALYKAKSEGRDCCRLC